jgi:multidrug efflux pump subunit AcrA (membrane-fusion protein)
MATRRRREDDELFGPPAQEDISDDAVIDVEGGAARPDEEADEPDSDLGLGEMGADSDPAAEELPADLADPEAGPVLPDEQPDALSEFPSDDAPAEPMFADEPAEEAPKESFWTRLGNRVPGRRALTNRRRGALIVVVLVVLAAIAAIIVGTQSSTPPPASGSAEVTSGSIRSTVNLDGVVVRQSTQNVSAPVTGTVSDIAVRPGDAVTEGEEIATVTVLQVAPSPSPTGFGSSPSPTPAASPINETLTAPIAGTVGTLSVTKGQIVVNGQQVLTVIPAQYDVIASVPQDQLYRFYSAPLSVQAVIPHQDQPVDCAFKSIGGNLPTSGATNVLGQEVDLRCTLPAGTSVFPGVRATVVAVTAEVDDALTLPVGAVQRTGTGNAGVVYVLEKGKQPQKTNVTLGITDGKRIQIVSGLFAGQRVRDPAVSGSPTP